jgi:hypothetical protein
MKGDTPTPQESQQPNTKKKHPFYWIWLIVAIIGIGVVYLGLSDIYHQIANVNRSIHENTVALQSKSVILSDIKDTMQQLIFTIKDSVNNIIRSI